MENMEPLDEKHLLKNLRHSIGATGTLNLAATLLQCRFSSEQLSAMSDEAFELQFDTCQAIALKHYQSMLAVLANSSDQGFDQFLEHFHGQLERREQRLMAS